MDTLTWKKFFDILAFVVVFAVPVILYLMEKAGASLTWIFIVGWLSIGVAALYLVLNLPWVWVNASLAVRIWRISFVSAVALLVVGYGATKIWPHSNASDAAHLNNPPEPKTSKEKPKLEPNPPAPHKPSPSAPMPNLRERGLRLSEEIMALVHDREQKAPANLVHPPESSVGARPQPDNTPLYMRETLSLFIGKFEGRIVDIHDEFAARGLQDVTLDSVFEHLPEMYGNIHHTINEVAESIRKLGLLTPPDGLYQNVSNERLYQLAVDEANNSETRAQTAFNKILSDSQNRNATRFFFYSEFRNCCLHQIEYLRAEMMKRIGPAAHDPDEMRLFNGPMMSITEMQPDTSISAVLRYIPKFRELAGKLK